MKAIVRESYGGPEVLQVKEISKPVPKKNEVLVKVYAASITKAETMMRTGKPYFGRLITGLFKPKSKVIGACFSGIIEAIGSEVTKFHKHDMVFGEVDMNTGTNAEYACVREDGMISIKPSFLSFEEAAPICDGAITSMNFLSEVVQLQPGQKVLINGASGSLGSAAIQLAKHFGAEVSAVCSSRNIEFVKSLGADHVIDYTKEDFTKKGAYDVIYDTIGSSSFTKCKNALTTNGIYLTPVLKFRTLMQMMFTSKFTSKKVKFSATGMLPAPKLQAITKKLLKIYETGQIKTVVSRKFTMDEIVKAHKFIDNGHKVGNIVLNTKNESQRTNPPIINMNHFFKQAENNRDQ